MQMIYNDVSNVEALIESDKNLYTLVFYVDIKTRLFISVTKRVDIE